MKIYTKTGDRGETALFGGGRVRKDDVRVCAYGEVDELNALLGVVRATGIVADLDTALERIQNELFVVGADLATPGEAKYIPRIDTERIEMLEQDIDRFESELDPLKQFILPGGTLSAAYLHLARTVCRRAERAVVTLHNQEPLTPAILLYLNRLSDWLFMLARLVNARAGRPDVPWQNPLTKGTNVPA